MQAHTILSELSSKYADQPVLVLGGKLNSVREVAERCFHLYNAKFDY